MTNLKQLVALFIFGVVSILIETSCNKNSTNPNEDRATTQRKIQFILYTTADFSDDESNISFSVSIQNSQNQVLWDSSMAPMKIKDIPDLAHKLLIEKTFVGDGNETLKVGFNYSIENVGYSWFYDTCSVGETFKQVNFDFQ